MGLLNVQRPKWLALLHGKILDKKNLTIFSFQQLCSSLTLFTYNESNSIRCDEHIVHINIVGYNQIHLFMGHRLMWTAQITY